MNIKNNKFIKYSLAFTIALICLIGGNISVEAEDFRLEDYPYCTYNITETDDTATYTTSYNFSVVYTSAKKIRVYNEFEKKADKFTVLDDTGLTTIIVDEDVVKNVFINRDGKFHCPTDAIVTYHDRYSTTYYLSTKSETDDYNKDFITIVKPTLVEDNSLTNSKGEKVCERSKFNEYVSKNKKLFSDIVQKTYDDEYKRLSNWTNTFKNATSTTVDQCNSYAASQVGNKVEESFNNNFQTQSANLLNELTQYCALSEQDVKTYSLYINGRSPITYQQKAQAMGNSIASIHQSNTNACLAKSNATEEEKKVVEDEAQKAVDDMKSGLNKAAEDYVNMISNIGLGNDVDVSCEGLLGDDLLDLISEVLNYVKIAAPILLLVLGSVDFGQAVISQDKDALSKAFSKFVKRAIICVVIFFLPIIIKYLLYHLDDYFKSNDPLCGIR